MKTVIAILTILSLANAAPAPKLSDKYSNSQQCKACHSRIVNEWSQSYHSKSHYDSNEYLRKSMDYYSKKTRSALNAVKIKCATCHNPRVSIASTDIYYDIDVLMKTDKDNEITKAANDQSLTEGVNCLVCHNIDSINHSLPAEARGMKRIEWNEVGMMSGPFKDAVSPYHKTQFREFFADPKQLCLICHANDRSVHGIVFTNTQDEYGDEKTQCAECHMGSKTRGHASNFPIENNSPKSRMVRKHTFEGAHSPRMWVGALKLSTKIINSNLAIKISNNIPHNIPTGFGARELLVEVEYFNNIGSLGVKTISLTQHYKDKRGKPTIPHLAKSATQSQSIPAKGSKTVTIAMLDNSSYAMVTLYYRLVNDEVREMLDLQEPQWSKKMFIVKIKADMD